MDIVRCPWAKGDLYHRYHDLQWGVPEHDDRMLFEMLILEGAQAGLSWETILKKRENYRAAFDQFDAERIAMYDDAKLSELLQNDGIIRNRLKVSAAVVNARAFLKTRDEFGSFDNYIWRFAGGAPIQNAFESMSQVPAKTLQSDAMSKDLSRRGFKFVGSTICYAFMQATGMVNDHLTGCFRWRELTAEPRS
jgi:DNA-3-methyladenine glycosylase I